MKEFIIDKTKDKRVKYTHYLGTRLERTKACKPGGHSCGPDQRQSVAGLPMVFQGDLSKGYRQSDVGAEGKSG